MADPYQTIGVARDASQDDIRKAYRKLAKETHPDLNPGNAEAEKRFKDISSAYDIIGDADKRKRFDAGEIDETGAEKPERHYYREYAEANPNTRYSHRTRREAGRENRENNGDGGYGDFDADDLFSDLFRGRRAGAGQQTFRMPGGDVQYRLAVDLLDAANGAKKTVQMPDGRTLDISIPAGVRDGQTLRLKGQGLPGSEGMPPGDAYVEIDVLPNDQFRREGNDIHSVLPISLGEALNGATVRAPTVDGAVDVKIPKRARDGMKMRLRGKGVKHGSAGTRGDQYVELKIAPPENPDDELANFMAAWETKHPQNPRKQGAKS